VGRFLLHHPHRHFNHPDYDFITDSYFIVSCKVTDKATAVALDLSRTDPHLPLLPNEEANLNVRHYQCHYEFVSDYSSSSYSSAPP